MRHGIGRLGKNAARVGCAKPSWDRAIAAGVACYDRSTHLARILPVGPDEIADGTVAGRRRILVRLARALRAERNRGRAGHWTYDLNRHIALTQAYAAERSVLADLTLKMKPPAGTSPAAENHENGE